jgi:hemerythrin
MGKSGELSAARSIEMEELEDQHHVLDELIDQMHNALSQRKGSRAVGEILDKLEDYSRVHFSIEESLMRILGYPDYEQHKGEHENLVAQLSELKEKVAAGKQSVSFQLLHFLKRWLANHVATSDKSCHQFFAAVGAEPLRLLGDKKRTIRIWDRLYE